ncbi:MAG: glycosyl transferase, partial [Hyphomicrobiaceae bacterium]
MPTPQGAGIAVVAAALTGTISMASLIGSGTPGPHLLPFVLAIVGLSLIGLVDDIRPLPPG